MLMYLGFYFDQGGAHARSVTSWIEQGGVEHTRRHTQVTIDRGGVNTQVTIDRGGVNTQVTIDRGGVTSQNSQHTREQHTRRRR